jgi:CHAP domain
VSSSSLHVSAFLFIATAACASAPDEDDVATASQEVAGGTLVGTWDGTNAFAQGGRCQDVFATSLTSAGYTQTSGSVLTDTCGFQCVELAVRYFHFRKGISAGSWHVGTAIEMCGSHPSGVSQTSSPASGDLVVLKANDGAVGTGAAGHVAVVRGTSGDSVETFNENWANDTTAFATISRSRDVSCFLHAGGGGGANGVGVAAGACTQTEITNATLNGVHYWTCQGAARYICDDHGNKIRESCPSGCASAGVGADDQCVGGGGPRCTSTEITNQTGAGSALPSIWTCQGSARYVCDGPGFKVTESCANGCLGEGFNHDDQCR